MFCQETSIIQMERVNKSPWMLCRTKVIALSLKVLALKPCSWASTWVCWRHQLYFMSLQQVTFMVLNFIHAVIKYSYILQISYT